MGLISRVSSRTYRSMSTKDEEKAWCKRIQWKVDDLKKYADDCREKNKKTMDELKMRIERLDSKFNTIVISHNVSPDILPPPLVQRSNATAGTSKNAIDQLPMQTKPLT